MPEQRERNEDSDRDPSTQPQVDQNRPADREHSSGGDPWTDTADDTGSAQRQGQRHGGADEQSGDDDNRNDPMRDDEDPMADEDVDNP